ncbi:MAG: 3-dehydroquinate synthase, partial [Nitratireductor sp.]
MTHMTESSIRLPVPLGGRSYDILIGPGLLADAGAQIRPLLKTPRVIVVTDAHVGPRYAPALVASLDGAGISAETITLPAGE